MRDGLSLLVLCGLAVFATAPSEAQTRDLAYRLPASLAPALADTLDRPPPRDDWFGRDKAMHAGASLGITLGAALVASVATDLEREAAIPLAAGLALGAGLGKEVADASRDRNPLFSWRDLASDAVGVAVGVALLAY